MPGVLPFLPSILGVAGSLFGGAQQQAGMNAQEQAAMMDSQAMNELINKAILPGFNTEMQTYQQDFAPLQQGISGAYGSLIPQLNLPGAYQGMQSSLGNLEGLGAQTIGGLGGLQGMTSNAFDLLNQTVPNAMKLYEKTAQHGYSPQVIGNAYNNLQVQNQQQMNSIKNQLGDALPNLAGSINDMQMNDAMSRAQLGSNLAAGDQALKLQGAGLATGLGQQVGQDIMSQVPQLAQLMQSQFGIGQDLFGANQQMFNAGMGAAGQMGNYANAGQSYLTNALNGLSNIAGMYGNMASGAASNMTNMMNQGGGFGGALSGIGNILSNLPGMGGGGFFPSDTQIQNSIGMTPPAWPDFSYGPSIGSVGMAGFPGGPGYLYNGGA